MFFKRSNLCMETEMMQYHCNCVLYDPFTKNCIETEKLWTLKPNAILSWINTYFYNPDEWHCHSIPVCTDGSFHPLCYGGTLDILLIVYHKPVDQTFLCYYCSYKADRHHHSVLGFHNSQMHNHHSEHLRNKKEPH